MSDQTPNSRPDSDDLGLSDEDLSVVAGGVDAVDPAALEGGKTTIIIIENP